MHFGHPDLSRLPSTVLSYLAATFGLLGLLCAGLVPGPASAQHPTAVTSIVNSAQDTTLEVNYNGSFLIPGTYGPTSPNDSIPATGAGTRMLWYPEKAAFRVGRVGAASGKEDVWDADSIGDYTVAFGRDTKATVFGAVAMGVGSSASGSAATALGGGTTASALGATAIGNGATASHVDATAMGFNTTANAPRSTAMGDESTTVGEAATAMGFKTRAGGEAAVATGSRTTAATEHSLTIGECNDANTSDDNTLFVAGNGSFVESLGSCFPSNALVLDDSGNLTISGSLTENSDRRLKKEIRPLGSGILQRLSRLRPVRYEFKNQETYPAGDQIGLLAQDVRKEFPQLVSKGSGGYLSLAYPKMTAVLLKGLQEQQAQLETKNSEIADLKAENEALKTQQQKIEKRLAALEAKRSSALPAGWGPAALLLLLVGGGGFGAGLLWRRQG